MVILLNTLIDK